MISIIVPVYKVEEFLNRCIDSLISQTYKDLEIILVDDGSPDNCGSICDEYAAIDNRIKVIHKTNGGLSSARNAGLKIAKGEYIAFVDSDDWVDPEMYEKLFELAQRYDADIVECGLRYFRPWKPERMFYEPENTKEVAVFTNIEALERLYFGPQIHSDICIMVWNKLYRRSLLANLNFADGFIHEDVDFTPKALFNANKVVKYYDSFYNYNIHLGANSTSGMKKNFHKLESTYEMKKRTYDFFRKNSVAKISDFTEYAFLEAIIDVVISAHGKSEPFEQLSKKAFAEYRKLYNRIAQNEFCKPKIKYIVFGLCPSLFYYIKFFYSKIKTILHK